jgi:hypothetical protein
MIARISSLSRSARMPFIVIAKQLVVTSQIMQGFDFPYSVAATIGFRDLQVDVDLAVD